MFSGKRVKIEKDDGTVSRPLPSTEIQRAKHIKIKEAVETHFNNTFTGEEITRKKLLADALGALTKAVEGNRVVLKGEMLWMVPSKAAVGKLPTGQNWIDRTKEKLAVGEEFRNYAKLQKKGDADKKRRILENIIRDNIDEMLGLGSSMSSSTYQFLMLFTVLEHLVSENYLTLDQLRKLREKLEPEIQTKGVYYVLAVQKEFTAGAPITTPAAAAPATTTTVTANTTTATPAPAATAAANTTTTGTDAAKAPGTAPRGLASQATVPISQGDQRTQDTIPVSQGSQGGLLQESQGWLQRVFNEHGNPNSQESIFRPVCGLDWMHDEIERDNDGYD
jgi:hypothetical protein